MVISRLLLIIKYRARSEILRRNQDKTWCHRVIKKSIPQGIGPLYRCSLDSSEDVCVFSSKNRIIKEIRFSPKHNPRCSEERPLFDQFLYDNPKIKVRSIPPTLDFSNFAITRTKVVPFYDAQCNWKATRFFKPCKFWSNFISPRDSKYPLW